ncbi:MAG: nicotinate-nucleotide--dimethylbenzimidazole phosphoribosyltransferase [Leptospira sp.]|nr:nicotinate-nucleotide--dimethylbenzimidazole phosphoribosyltransferase [Leptospira sp.]
MKIITTDFIQSVIDNKTKPPGSLGRLESIALQIAQVQNTINPCLIDPTILVFAGDHGIAESGVSAFPQKVTYQMVLNFLRGGAAINVFAKQHNIQLKVIDAGVIGNFSDYSHLPNFYNRKIAEGTKNFANQIAMTEEECAKAIESGKEIAIQETSLNCNVIGFGEMGIGNTSSASLIMSSVLNIPINECIGKGTGVTGESLEKKFKILNEAQKFHDLRVTPLMSDDAAYNSRDALEILRTFGGFEMAQIIGAMLASYRKNRILMIDGFIASACFLVARCLEPNILSNAIFCHRSDESGHKKILEALDVSPILDLNMRLGEGTGCAVAYPIIESAVNFINNMASFDEAGVSNQ